MGERDVIVVAVVLRDLVLVLQVELAAERALEGVLPRVLQARKALRLLLLTLVLKYLLSLSDVEREPKRSA